MLIVGRRRLYCSPRCVECPTKVIGGAGWAQRLLTRITPEEFDALSWHQKWERGKAAKISRRAWHKTAAYRRSWAARAGEPCALCGSRSDLTLDHIWPLLLGGTHDDANLRALCGPCNSRKGVKV